MTTTCNFALTDKLPNAAFTVLQQTTQFSSSLAPPLDVATRCSTLASPAGIGWSDEVNRRFTQVNKHLATDLGYDSEAELLALVDVETAMYAYPNDRQTLLKKVNEARGKSTEHRFVAKRKQEGGAPTDF